MNDRAGDDIIDGPNCIFEGVDVNAAEDELRPIDAAVADLLDRDVGRVIFAHEADLHEPFAASNLLLDDLSGLCASGCQRLFAQNRLAAADTGPRQRGMEPVRRGDHDCIDLRRRNQLIGIAVEGRAATPVRHLLGRALCPHP